LAALPQTSTPTEPGKAPKQFTQLGAADAPST
jgi:hypothetical protein